MLNRRRLAGALVALLLPTTALLQGVTTARAADPAVPPACAQADKDVNCLHAPTPDVTALPSPTFTTTYDPKSKQRTVTVSAAFPAPYHVCPSGGVPYSYLPCTDPGFSMTPRVYVPGATAAAGGGSLPVPGQTCVFTCTFSFVLDYTYHGPATIILSYTALEILATATNDLFTSTYENTITVPSSPFAGALVVTKPTVVFSGKAKTQTIKLTGKGGIPTAGVGGVIAIITAAGGVDIKGGNDFIGDGQPYMEAINGTSVRLIKKYPGAVSITTVGYWLKAAGDTGNLMHKFYQPLKLPVKGKSLVLKKWNVPANATGALLVVSAPKAATRVGGLLVPKYFNPEEILVPLGSGAKLALNKIGKGSTVSLAGFVSPVKAVDTGLSFDFVKAPESVAELLTNSTTETT